MPSPPRWIRKAIHVTLDGADREPERIVRGPGCLCQPIKAPGRVSYAWPVPGSSWPRTIPAGASQRGQDHEDLVAVVAGRDTQRPRPAADHLPAQPAVEVLKAGAAPQCQVKLLKTHLLAGDAPGLCHQGAADSLTPESGVRLQTVDGSPVRHQRAQLTLDVEPARQDTVGQCQQEPAAPWVQASDQLGGHR